MIQPLSVADSCSTKNRVCCTVYKGPLSQQKNIIFSPSLSSALSSHKPLKLQVSFYCLSLNLSGTCQ
jgi:hypothetical protein